MFEVHFDYQGSTFFQNAQKAISTTLLLKKNQAFPYECLKALYNDQFTPSLPPANWKHV